MTNKKASKGFLTIVYIICGILTILSIMPFLIMVINATRSTTEIQQHAISLIPSSHLLNNFQILTGKSFQPFNAKKDEVLFYVAAAQHHLIAKRHVHRAIGVKVEEERRRGLAAVS